MRRSVLCTIVCFALAVTSCGSDSSSGSIGAGGGGGGEAGNGSDGPSCDPAVHCGGFTCGVHAVSSCGEVDCGACRFFSADVTDGDITLSPEGKVHLASFSDGKLTHSISASASLDSQEVTDDPAGKIPSIAVAPDGTIHIVWSSSGIQHAEQKPGSTSWEIHSVGEGTQARVAVDGAGVPHIIVLNENQISQQATLMHVVRTGASYTSTPIDGPSPIGFPAIGRGADGTIALAYRGTALEGLRRVEVFTLVNGSFQHDTSAPELPDQVAEVSVAVTSAGTLQLAVLVGNYTLKTGSKLLRMTRAGASWTTDTLVGTEYRVTSQIALAGGPEDRLHLFFYASGKTGNDGLFYTRPNSTRALNFAPRCDKGTVRAVVDPLDQVHVLFRCDSGSALYMKPSEPYPKEYTEACTKSASDLCEAACACGSPSCCYGSDPTNNSNSCSFGPGGAARAICEQKVLQAFCSDLTASPSPMLSCAASLAEKTPACINGAAVVPEACRDLANQ